MGGVSSTGAPAPVVAQVAVSGTLAGTVPPRPVALFKAPQLRALRLARMLSQERLAEEAGVARTAIVHLERGGAARAETIQKLARYFNVTPAKLGVEPADSAQE
jgi:DNA-binding XRE family transcriptional regulator